MDKMCLVIAALLSSACFASANNSNLEFGSDVQIQDTGALVGPQLDDEMVEILVNATDPDSPQAYVQYAQYGGNTEIVSPYQVLSRRPRPGWEQISFSTHNVGTLIYWIKPGYSCRFNYRAMECRRN